MRTDRDRLVKTLPWLGVVGCSQPLAQPTRLWRRRNTAVPELIPSIFPTVWSSRQRAHTLTHSHTATHTHTHSRTHTLARATKQADEGGV